MVRKEKETKSEIKEKKGIRTKIMYGVFALLAVLVIAALVFSNSSGSALFLRQQSPMPQPILQLLE